jgi:DTW domain-containing protein
MSRRNNFAHRCERCRMHQSLCVCALIPRVVTRTRVLLVIHRSEDRKPTNTGRLAADCLVNSEVVRRGDPSAQAGPLPIPEGTVPILLYPAEDAVPLVDLAPRIGEKPVTLIVPDGNWRQAFKVRNRVPGLREVACVTLPASLAKPSIYRLRSEAHAHGLATIEAIARALRVLEGSRGREIEEALEFPFRAMVERTLWARGALEAEDVTGGIPQGAERHDPVSGVLAAARAR